MGSDVPLLSKTLGGRFKITSHIGEGAMASVFRGVDLSGPSGSEVAVKVMHPHLAADRTFTARFKREAEAASMVKHPNSVAILDVGEEQGVHYIVMELCGGRDLRETLKAERRLPEPRAIRIVMTICDALHVAHQLGVVHRDLKPENVMIQHDPAAGTDLVKVLDFGIAKLVDAQPKMRMSGSDSDPPPALTQFGVVVGTPQYMSPEQCRGQPLDGRSDVYTCGILLYQLVTGALPFNSESPFEVAGKQAFEPPPPPHTFFPQIDPELEAIILRVLSKLAADRPQSAMELKEVLQRWLDTHVPGAAPAPNQGRAGAPPGPPRPPPPPPPRPPPPPAQQPATQAPMASLQPPSPPAAPPRPPQPPAAPQRPMGPEPPPQQAPPAPPPQQSAAEGLRALGRTMPLNDGAGQTLGNAVADYLARNPGARPEPLQQPSSPEARLRALAGPFVPTSSVAAVAPVEPSPFDQGPLGTVVAMEAVKEPPQKREAPPPAAGAPMGGPKPDATAKIELYDPHTPLPGIAPVDPMPERPGLETFASDSSSRPHAAPPIGPGPGGLVAPGGVAYPMGHPAHDESFDEPAKGWGMVGVLMILLSLAAGVGVGFGLYRWAPF